MLLLLQDRRGGGVVVTGGRMRAIKGCLIRIIFTAYSTWMHMVR